MGCPVKPVCWWFGGRGPEVLLEPVSKGSASLTYILLRTVDGWVFVLVYDPTLEIINNNNNGDNHNNNNNRNILMVVPYIQGLSEKYKRICNKKGIQVHFKGSNTIKILLMAHKDNDTKLQKSGVIYQYKCPTINCPEEYIGGTGRAFRERLKEYLRVTSPNHQHTSFTGHPITPDCFNIIHREAQDTTRKHQGGYVHQGQWAISK